MLCPESQTFKQSRNKPTLKRLDITGELCGAQPNHHATMTMIMMTIPLARVIAGKPCALLVAFLKIHQRKLNNLSQCGITCSSLTSERHSKWCIDIAQFLSNAQMEIRLVSPFCLINCMHVNNTRRYLSSHVRPMLPPQPRSHMIESSSRVVCRGHSPPTARNPTACRRM